MPPSSELNRLLGLDSDRIVLFVGAGFTRDLGFPTWVQLIERLATVAEQHEPLLGALMRKRLASRNLLSAADPFFAPEIPANSRAAALKEMFEAEPALKWRHKLLAQLPCLAIVTTNYDTTIERAIGLRGEAVHVLRGSERFTTFNSSLQLRQEALARKRPSAKPILKIHNDTAAPENVVLHSAGFESISATAGFLEFYRNSLRNHHLVFVGFSGDDPNLQRAIFDGVKNFAGYGLSESFFITTNGSPNPLSGNGSNVSTIYYDPQNEHSELVQILESAKAAWRPHGNFPSTHPSIFELLIPAIQDNADTRIVDLVGRRMVSEAKRASGDQSERSLANQLSQQYRLDPTRATELVRRHSPSATTTSENSADAAQVLADGVHKRCLPFDAHFRLSATQLKPIIKATIESALLSQGCAAALALLRSDAPGDLALSSVIRTILREKPPPGLGDADIESLEPALADLFMNPTPAEDSILARLAVTSTAFGLIQAIPSLEQSDGLLPHKIFLDTNVVLPLLAKTQPRYSAYETLLRMSKTIPVKLRLLSSFVNELEAHYVIAIRIADHHKLHTVDAIRKWSEQGLPETRNVFLLGLAQSAVDGGRTVRQGLEDIFGKGSHEEFANLAYRLGIEIEPAIFPAPDDFDQVKAMIVLHKETLHEGSSRDILASNEVAQLLKIRAEQEHGRHVWFVTGDAQLRGVVRTYSLPGGGAVLPIMPAIALLESLSAGMSLGPGYARSLWGPSRTDEVDQALSAEIRRLAATVDFARPQPIAQARSRAREEYLARCRRSPDSEPSLAHEPIDAGAIAKESVLLALGEELERARRRNSDS
jgi:hypothetical protein